MTQTITLHPGDKPGYDPSQYTLKERRWPGPWQSSRIEFQMNNLDDAIAAAQARIQWESGLLIRVVDQHGKVHWTNENHHE